MNIFLLLKFIFQTHRNKCHFILYEAYIFEELQMSFFKDLSTLPLLQNIWSRPRISEQVFWQQSKQFPCTLLSKLQEIRLWSTLASLLVTSLTVVSIELTFKRGKSQSSVFSYLLKFCVSPYTVFELRGFLFIFLTADRISGLTLYFRYLPLDMVCFFLAQLYIKHVYQLFFLF